MTVPPPTAETPEATAPAGAVPAIGDEDAERALEGYRQLLALQERLDDPTVDAAELLRNYEILWSTWRVSLDADSAGRVLRAIESLEADVESAEAAAALEERGDLTVFERLAYWRELAAAGGRRGARAAAKVAELEEIVASSATVLGTDKFVTCNGVRRSAGVPAGPAGVRDDFRPGQVHVFAWVNAPRPRETLTLEWVDSDGTVAHSRKVSVGRNTATGYRIFYNKGHAAAGRYEVRLYNEAGTLIGRRAFTVS